MLEHHAREGEVVAAARDFFGREIPRDIEAGGAITFRQRRDLDGRNVVDRKLGANLGERLPPEQRIAAAADFDQPLGAGGFGEMAHDTLVIRPRPPLAVLDLKRREGVLKRERTRRNSARFGGTFCKLGDDRHEAFLFPLPKLISQSLKLYKGLELSLISPPARCPRQGAHL